MKVDVWYNIRGHIVIDVNNENEIEERFNDIDIHDLIEHSNPPEIEEYYIE